jgi:P27 family predicted phage terminase small subunit
MGRNVVVSINKMEAGSTTPGKHWTQKEIKAREKANLKMTREKKKLPVMPIWLGPEAKAIWKKTMSSLKGFDILDVIDSDILALYCNTMADYIKCVEMLNENKNGLTTINKMGTEEMSPYVKAQHRYMGLIAQYADKLGISPDARARLAKKIADEELKPKDDDFGD